MYNNSYKTYDASGLTLGTTAKETPYLHTANIMNFEEYDTLNITIDETYGIADDGVIFIIKPEIEGKDVSYSLSSGVNTIYMEDLVEANVTSGYIGIGFAPSTTNAYVHMTAWYLTYKNDTTTINEE